MRLFAVVLLLILLPLAALAQNAPAFEISAGYQYLRADTNGAQKLADSLTNSFTPPLPRINVGSGLAMNGGNFEVEANAKSWWGGMFDFGGSYGNRHVDLSQVAASLDLVPPGTPVIAIFRPHVLTFTGGPQFHYRKHERVQPFARILLGGAHADLGPDAVTQQVLNIVVPTFRTSRNSFAGIAGGGVDYVWKPYVGFRFAGDYVRTYLFDGHQSNLRVTAGVNFRFGQNNPHRW